MTLLKHNEQTLVQVNEFVRKNLDCCVVNPCGSGKTYIMAKFIKQHSDSTFMIITKQKNASDYYREKDEIFSKNNVKIVTYSKMLNDFKANSTDNYNTDFMLIDEAHYLGATNWNKAFTHIVSKYRPRLIGFTATPQRFEDQGTDNNIVIEYFNGNSAGNFTTKQLADEGVLVEPEYILSLYNLQDIIDEKIDKLNDSDLDEHTKKKFNKKLNNALEKWKNESNPEKILKENLPNYMYKKKCNRILVYVSNLEELPAKREYINNLVKNIFKHKKIKDYTYTYKNHESELKDFLTEDDNNIKILYSIDKIMETIHIDDLRIIIMLRPSVSNRIITQQFGRINNVDNKLKPIIFDMVDNLSNIDTVTNNTLFGERIYNISNNQKNVTIPHITYYGNLFTDIDKALSRFKYYTYNGFTGSLSDICKINCRRLDEVRDLMTIYDLDEAIKRTKPIKSYMTQNIFDDTYDFDNLILTETQKQYAENNMHIVNNFIKRKNISDDDMIQNLYMMYLYVVSKTDGKYEIDYQRNQRISLDIKRFYIICLKNKTIRNNLFEDYAKAISELNDKTYNIEDLTLSDDLDELTQVIDKVLNRLPDRTATVIKLRFGLDGQGTKELEIVSKKLNVTRERIRQIEAKGIRTLRHPVNKRKYDGYYEYVVDRDKNITHPNQTWSNRILSSNTNRK